MRCGRGRYTSGIFGAQARKARMWRGFQRFERDSRTSARRDQCLRSACVRRARPPSRTGTSTAAPMPARGGVSGRSSAMSSTSSIHFTGTIFMPCVTFFGNVGEILAVLVGNDHGADAAAQRRQQLLLQSADRQHAAAQRDLAGHRHVGLDRDLRVSIETSAVAIAMPALGPSFGVAPSGTCTCTSCFCRKSRSMPSARCAHARPTARPMPIPSSRRRAGR